MKAAAARHVGTVGAQLARAASGTYPVVRDVQALERRVLEAEERAKKAERENAVLRAELEIQGRLT